MTKHVYFIKLMYFLKLRTIKTLKQKKERCLTFFAETKFAVSGAPSTRIFELMGSSQLGVPEGYSVTTESPSRALLFYTEKQVHPTEEEREIQELYSLEVVRFSMIVLGDSWVSGVPVPGSPFAFLVLSPL